MPNAEVLIPSSGASFGLDKAAEGDREDSKTGSSHMRPSLNAEVCSKHPLQNTWTMWFYKNDRNKDWEDNQKAVIDFSTVEDFWALFNHIEEVGKLNHGCDYSLFKRGVKPMWEDEHNRGGGRWVISLDKGQRVPELNNIWLEIMLLMIGEAFGEDHGKCVNGAVVSVRTKGDRIAVWLGPSALNTDAVQSIGRKIKESLAIPPKVKISFEMHEDTKHRTSSRSKVQYTI